MADRPSSIPAAVRDALAGRYRIEEELGLGATAIVCRAFDERHGRTVAIKILHSDLVGTAVRERFLREIEFAARLQHPHIVPLLEAGDAGGSVFLAMPLVEGETLRDRLDRGPPLGINEIVRIVVDLADALNYAHRHGVVHRDLKPANILLTGRHALLTDFGVAKALHLIPEDPQLTQGMAVGTPTYMSPEQASGSAAVDHRADLYALGVVAYEMVAGRRPFVGKTPQEVLTAHVVMRPEPIGNLRPDLPLEIAQVIDTCLAKDPADRFQSASELVDRLELLVDSSGRRPVVAGGTRSRWWVAATLGALAVAALVWALADGRSERTVPVRPEQLSFLGTVREAALSPDGALVAYVTAGTEGQQLWVRDARGVGDPLGIARSERIVGVNWVNQGREISFAEGPVEAPLTRTVSPLGGASRVVGRGRGVVSPDGNLVLIASGGDPTLLVLRSETGDTITIRRPVDGWTSGVAWAPGSDRLAVSVLAPDRSRSTVWVIDLSGAASMIRAESVEVQAPRWAPSGDAVYYLAGPRGRAKDLRRVRLGRGGDAELIAANLAVPEDSRRHPTGSALSLSGDGRLAVVVQGETWSNLARFRLEAAPLASQPTPELFTMGTALYSSPRLSPDEETIAVFVSTARGTTLGTAPLQGSAITELTTVVQGGGLAWRPDGLAVAYTGEVGDSGLRLFTRELAGGGVTRVGDLVGAELDWGASGLVAQRPGNRGLVRIEVGGPSPAPDLPDDNPSTTYSPRISPDGRRVAVLWYSGNGGRVALAVADVGSERYRPLLEEAFRPVGWSRDGREVFAARNAFAPAPEELVAVDAERGTIRPLAVLPAGFRVEDVSRDGRLVLATRLEFRSDAWRLELPSEP